MFNDRAGRQCPLHLRDRIINVIQQTAFFVNNVILFKTSPLAAKKRIFSSHIARQFVTNFVLLTWIANHMAKEALWYSLYGKLSALI